MPGCRFRKQNNLAGVPARGAHGSDSGAGAWNQRLYEAWGDRDDFVLASSCLDSCIASQRDGPPRYRSTSNCITFSNPAPWSRRGPFDRWCRSGSDGAASAWWEASPPHRLGALRGGPAHARGSMASSAGLGARPSRASTTRPARSPFRISSGRYPSILLLRPHLNRRTSQRFQKFADRRSAMGHDHDQGAGRLLR